MRYSNLRRYLKNRFGGSVAKISLDAGFTCPNRDGTISHLGCLFCDPDGSGTGAAQRGVSIPRQIERAIKRSGRRIDFFFAYFQAFTNTYAPTPKLKEIWDQAMSYERIVGLAVGTRPDCLAEDALDLLAEHHRRKEVWLELGLQSADNQTLDLINRGHTAEDFAKAVERAKARGLKTLAHVIIGLPGEEEEHVLSTARFVADLGMDGIKIHSLYVTRGTPLAERYESGEYPYMDQEEFVRLAVLTLENLPQDMVIHRLTGDPKLQTLLGPPWALDKNKTLEMIRARLEELDTWQGAARGAPRPDPDRTAD